MSEFLRQTEVIAAVVGAIAGGLVSEIIIIISSFMRSRGKLILFANESKYFLHRRDSVNTLPLLPT